MPISYYGKLLSNDILIMNEISYVAITGWALFLISEVMPFLKKKENFNGVLHTAICILRGSKCFVDKALEVANSNIAKPADIENGVDSQKE